MLQIEGSERTMSQNSDSPYKEIRDIESELNQLKMIKTKLQNDLNDKKWDKMPKIFHYAASKHTEEALQLHGEIIKLREENKRLKQNMKF